MFGAIWFNPGVCTGDGTHPALVVAVAPDFGARAVACHCVLLGADGRKVDVTRPRRSFGPVGAEAAYLGEGWRPTALAPEVVVRQRCVPMPYRARPTPNSRPLPC